MKHFLARYVERWNKDSAAFREDIAKTIEILDHYGEYGMLGGMLLVDGQIAGFALGEVIGDTLYTHIEKADRDYLGCYQMLVSQFAQQFAVDGLQLCTQGIFFVFALFPFPGLRVFLTCHVLQTGSRFFVG